MALRQRDRSPKPRKYRIPNSFQAPIGTHFICFLCLTDFSFDIYIYSGSDEEIIEIKLNFVIHIDNQRKMINNSYTYFKRTFSTLKAYQSKPNRRIDLKFSQTIAELIYLYLYTLFIPNQKMHFCQFFEFLTHCALQGDF